MLQVRWNLKPTTTKDKKTLAASFNPIKERFKAHRDFDLHATEIPSKKRGAQDKGSNSKQSGSASEQRAAKQQKQRQPFDLSRSSTSESSDTDRGDANTSDTASNQGNEIGILDFDACDELEYDIDLQDCFQLDSEYGLGSPKEQASKVFGQPSFVPQMGGTRSSVVPLRELEDMYDLGDAGVFVMSEQEVMALAADDARELALATQLEIDSEEQQ